MSTGVLSIIPMICFSPCRPRSQMLRVPGVPDWFVPAALALSSFSSPTSSMSFTEGSAAIAGTTSDGVHDEMNLRIPAERPIVDDA